MRLRSSVLSACRGLHIAFTLCLFCSLSCARTADLPDNGTDANKQGDVSLIGTGGLTNAIQEVVADVVLINSIMAGSVIVNTTVVTTNSSAPAVVDAASGGFNQTLPPSTFGQPTVSAVTVTPASPAILSATPPTLTQPPPTSGPSGPPATTPPPPTVAGPTGTTGPVPPSTPPVTQNYFIGPTSAALPPTTINGSNQTVIIGPVG
ncbi:hypothetical protein WJX75_002044 [Coccomyxa subellipsoidea]|uniref:Uncharacterized protein n=1 Tax=Coccomyxa subellipsoidea TaxID=248742 RepID=A0ABR2YCR6_9CHLO